MDAAWKLVIKQGLEKTTVAQIAAKANAGTGTFYNYFPSKEMALAVYLNEGTVKVVEAIEINTLPDDPEEAITNALGAILDKANVKMDKQILRELMAASFRAPVGMVNNQESATTKLVSSDEAIISLIAQILMREPTRAMLRDDLDPMLAATTIYSHWTMGWMGFIVEYIPDLPTVLVQIQAMNHLLFGGLRKESDHA